MFQELVGRLVGWSNISRPWWSRNVWGPTTMVVAKCFKNWLVGWLVGQTFRDHGGREMFGAPRPWWSRNVSRIGWSVGWLVKHFATMVVAKCLGPHDHGGREMFPELVGRLVGWSNISRPW